MLAEGCGEGRVFDIMVGVWWFVQHDEIFFGKSIVNSNYA